MGSSPPSGRWNRDYRHSGDETLSGCVVGVVYVCEGGAPGREAGGEAYPGFHSGKKQVRKMDTWGHGRIEEGGDGGG